MKLYVVQCIYVLLYNNSVQCNQCVLFMLWNSMRPVPYVDSIVCIQSELCVLSIPYVLYCFCSMVMRFVNKCYISFCVFHTI